MSWIPSFLSRSSVSDALVREVASIHTNEQACEHAKKHGLSITSIQWTDVSRYKDMFGNNISCWGNNITDACLRLSNHSINLPVIRFPNFVDKSVVLPISDAHFKLVSTRGEIGLLDYLKTGIKDSTGNVVDLSCELDTKHGVLTSAQQSILPLENGTCEFNSYVFNYQTYDPSNPGLLFILSTSTNTSPQTAVNRMQTLYANQNGQACNLTATRLKEDRILRGKSTEGEMDAEELKRNFLIVYSVPLKQRAQLRRSLGDDDCSDTLQCLEACSASFQSNSSKKKESYVNSMNISSNMNVMMSLSAQVDKVGMRTKVGIDHAMLGVGKAVGRFENGTEHVLLERDPTKLVRADVAFYSVTDSGTLEESVFRAVREKIDALYANGKAVGSANE